MTKRLTPHPEDRLNAVLDGDLDPARLGFAERRALADGEALIRDVLGSIPAGRPPDLAGAVQERIAAGRFRPRRGLIHIVGGWLWRPRHVALAWRQAYALPGLLLLGALLTTTPEPAVPTPIPAVDTARTVHPVLVQFRLDAPAAQHVTLAGDFTLWRPEYALTRSGPGVWTVVVPLDPGVHDYAFVVDGETWVPDPMAPAVDDGFGGLNSRVSVLAPDNGRAL